MKRKKKDYEGHATIKSDDVLTFGAFSISVQTLEISSKRMINTMKNTYMYAYLLNFKPL